MAGLNPRLFGSGIWLTPKYSYISISPFTANGGPRQMTQIIKCQYTIKVQPKFILKQLSNANSHHLWGPSCILSSSTDTTKNGAKHLPSLLIIFTTVLPILGTKKKESSWSKQVAVHVAVLEDQELDEGSFKLYCPLWWPSCARNQDGILPFLRMKEQGLLDNSNCSINLRQSNPTTLEQRGQLLCPVTNMVLEPVAALTRLGEFLPLTLDNATAAPVELLRYIPPQKHLHLLWVLFC